MTQVELVDAVKLTGIRRTADGYLAAVANVARPGIQEYRGFEVGRPELDIVRVYRPPEEVFAPDSMRTFAHRPVTLDHPPEAVTAENWKQFAIGQTGDEIDGRDGKFLRVPLVLMDAAAIKRVEDGHRELSMGYQTNLRFEDGVTPDGEKYDAVQSEIRANHLAVVKAARGGPQLRIGDGSMTMKTIVVDGVSVEVPDTAAQVIKRTIDRLTDALEEAEKKGGSVAEQIAAKQAEIERLQAEIATLKAQLEEGNKKTSPEQLDAMIRARDESIGKAKALVGDSIVTEGRTIEDIRRQVVTAKLGDTAKGWTDDQVAVSFATLTSSTKTADGKTVALGQVLQHQPHQAAADQAYNASVSRLQDAWKGKRAQG